MPLVSREVRAAACCGSVCGELPVAARRAVDEHGAPVRVQVPGDEVPLHAGSDRGGDAGKNVMVFGWGYGLGWPHPAAPKETALRSQEVAPKLMYERPPVLRRVAVLAVRSVRERIGLSGR